MTQDIIATGKDAEKSAGVLIRNLIDQAERPHLSTIAYVYEDHGGKKIVTEITMFSNFYPLGFKEQVKDYISEELIDCDFECTWWKKDENGNITKIY